MTAIVRSLRAATALCLLIGAGGRLALGSVPASASSLSDPAPLPSTLFSYPDFTAPSGPSLNLVGQAQISSSALQLVGNDEVGPTSGEAWYANQVDVDSSWETQFTFQVPASGGSPEGLAFVIQGQSATARGADAQNLGFAGISNSLAVEIGLTSNPDLGEPAAPFISVQTAGAGQNSASFQDSIGFSQPGSVSGISSGLHTITVAYSPPAGSSGGELEVFLDDISQPVAVALPGDLGTELGLTNGQAWMGFTAASGTGQNTETANIDSWSFQPRHADELAITSPALSGPASARATQGPVSVTLVNCGLAGAPGPCGDTPVDATADLTVSLQSSSPGGVFGATSGGPSLTSVTIPAGSPSATFYYGDTQAGAPVITATPQAAGVTAATQSETITPAGPASITLSPASATVDAGSSQDYQVEAFDAFGNQIGDVTAQSTISVPGFGTCPAAVCTTTTAEFGTQQVDAGYTTASGTLHAPAATLTVDEAPSITSLAAASFEAGVAGQFLVTTGAEFPVPSITESGSLPAGVSFTDNGNGTAQLSGTPAAGSGGTYPIIITAGNGVSPAATQSFTLTVDEAPSITSPAAASFEAGVAGQFLVTTGAEFPVPSITESGSLPAGVSFTDNGNGTAQLSGTPAAGSGGTYPIIITAGNGVSPAATQSFTLTVDEAPSITSPASTTVGMRAPFDFTVTTTGIPTAAITESGALPSGVTFTDNGDGTASLAGTAAAGTAGSYPITITASNGAGSPASQSFTLTVSSAASAPAITSDPADTETFGVPFSFTVTTTGYPAPKITKSGALPSGVTFADNGDGTATISGTPAKSAVGAYTLTLTAKSSAGTVTQTFTLTITKAPVIKKIPTTTAHVGVALNLAITASGYTTPAITESGALPSGLSFTDNGNGTATITGTPAAGSGGSYPITITATNQLGTTSQTFTLNVDEAPAITSADTAAAVTGSAFSFQVTTTGFPAPKITKAGSLPKGVSFKAATGTFTGTPKAGTSGSYPIAITATNSSGTTTQNFTLTVS
jgi:hypothetical protein